VTAAGSRIASGEWQATVKATKLPGEGRGHAFFHMPQGRTWLGATSWAQATVARESRRGRQILQVTLSPDDA
jgi:hypothetical protein